MKNRVPRKRNLDGGEHQIELHYSYFGFLFLVYPILSVKKKTLFLFFSKGSPYFHRELFGFRLTFILDSAGFLCFVPISFQLSSINIFLMKSIRFSTGGFVKSHWIPSGQDSKSLNHETSWKTYPLFSTV